MSDDYAERAAKFGLASKDAIKDVASLDDAVFLDVRSAGELESSSLKSSKPVVHIHVTMDDQSNIAENAPTLLPNKDAPVVVFCGIGGRASKAIDALKTMGYTRLYNAGGLKDMGYLAES